MQKPGITLTILLGLIIILTIYTTGIQAYYYETYNTFAWDLGIFLQSLENFVFHGKLFYNTVELPYNPSGSYFGIHFSPILFLFAIPYEAYPHPLTLFLIKNALICLTSLILYQIGKKKGLSETSSMLIASAYLFFLPIYGPLTTDFHPYSIFPFFISLTHLYVLRREHYKAFIATILGLSTNEVAAILYLFYGLCLLFKGLKSIAKRITILSIIWFVLAFTTIALLNPMQWHYYIHYQFINPLFKTNSMNKLLLIPNPDAAPYLLILYGFLLFLPLFSYLEGVLAIFPWLLILIITNHLEYSSPYYQYSALISAQMFLAAINTLKRLKKAKIMSISLAILNISLTIILGPIGFGALDHTTGFARPAHFHTIYRFDLINVKTFNKKALDNALSIIPENASVLVQNHVFPHIYKKTDSYVSLISGITGWPIVYEDLDMKKVKRISIFSALNGARKFLGKGKVDELILNGKRIDLKGNTSIIELKKPVKVTGIFFRCRLKPEEIGISQAILSSEAFELGMGSNGYLVLLLYSDHRETVARFSHIALKANNWYELRINITQHDAIVKLNENTIIKLSIRNRVVAWVVDNVDYVILDSTASTWNFRAGVVPLILRSEYKLIAAGDGVMVFSKNKSEKNIQNLTEDKYLLFIYASDNPSKNPVMTMPLSELTWKLINIPLAPQCSIIDLKGILNNISISGSEEYAFTKPVSKAYSANSIRVRCSAIIRGKIAIPEDGYYILKVKKMAPSSLEIWIDGERVSNGEFIYFLSGTHSIKIIWRKIRYPLLQIQLKRVSDS